MTSWPTPPVAPATSTVSPGSTAAARGTIVMSDRLLLTRWQRRRELFGVAEEEGSADAGRSSEGERIVTEVIEGLEWEKKQHR